MPLIAGELLGPYEILAPLGAGGMGEVWKARDTRLGRIVAVKTSSAKFTERFGREARAVAALNHANICQIYDVGPDYLVMEYVEGTRLSPVDSPRKLLDIAVQLSDGLAAAHAAHFIHRDLKPDNILVTKEGRVKILDFGLARSASLDLGPDDKTRVDVTDPGSTVGTIAYMSPEQARGEQNLTTQSDQFSLGLVLYEMAAAKQAFRRDSAAETMTAIIREEADPLPATVPAPLRWIIERLLSKEPAERYDSTRDLYRELKQLRDRLSEATSSGSVSTPQVRPRRSSKLKRVAAGIAIAALASAATWFLRPVNGTAQEKFTPMEVSWENPLRPIWSPDGKAFAFVAGAAGDRHVFLRYLNSPTPVQLTPSGEWTTAGWSPDGKRVIVRARNPQGSKPPWALFSVAVFGGEPQLIMPLEGEYAAVPTVAPDGNALVAVRVEQGGKLSLYTASPVGSAMKRYTAAPFDAVYQTDGSTAQFSQDGRSIMAVLEAVGGRQTWKLPFPAGHGTAERILKDLPGGEPRWSWFPNSRNFVLSLNSHLWLAGIRSGLRRPLTAGISSESQVQPAISPDGAKILFLQSGTDYMILSASLSDASVQRVISSEMTTGMPAWAPHRNEFVYASERSGSPAIWMRGESGEKPIVTVDSFSNGTTLELMTPTLSPNADRVIYTQVGEKEHQAALWISSVSGGPPVRLTNAQDAVELGASWSPDGGQVVYWQFRNGKAAVMVASTNGEVTPAMLRGDVGNTVPEWSPDGLWIKFLDRAQGGWALVSPDGKTVRAYGEPRAVQTTFSADSKRLYGIRADQDRRTLFSLDLATKEVKTIGEISRDFAPVSFSNPGLRLSLSPDGKNILYPGLRRSGSLWMLEGFDPPSRVDWLREMLPW